ncbi:ABC transporter permease [Planococcus lenghuensis]|uniref:Protein EcsB n=1 Tax=Planococcus lenghuensis TaxID=2213202 RepID=A0A1Q2KWG5_9BACL|nr:ABC transporter permease [Planococcus lenghuensis]AQQ52558.1 protein EcsB [Planococcus lenghuensis]
MKSLHDVWTVRMRQYALEVQNYMKYIFTGHLAVVLLFAIGAAGYAYSGWLTDIPENFPAALLLAPVFGLLLAVSPPSTLLKEADSVYFLPLESRLDVFLKPALRWTFMSQLYLPVIIYIVSLPMINALYGVDSAYLIGFPVLLLLMKWFNVKSEFAFRKWQAGQGLWRDRLGRFLLAALFVYFYVEGQVAFAALPLFAMILYMRRLLNKAEDQPFPFDHFIALEQGRLLRFYRFANYFTDVPHIKGKVRRRGWLDPIYRLIGKGKKNAHLYLVARTFIRFDDLFYLWVRLTLIAMIGVWFVSFAIGVWIFAAALAFATAIQLRQGMNGTSYFRMDELFPLSKYDRSRAVRQLIFTLQVIQAVLVALVAVGDPLTALIIFAAVLAVSSVTLQVAGK